MNLVFEHNQLVLKLNNCVRGGRKQEREMREVNLSFPRIEGTTLVFAQAKELKDGWRVHFKRDKRGSKLTGKPIYTYADTLSQVEELLFRFYDADK